MDKNKYSPNKIVWFHDKMNSFVDGRVTAPIYIRIKPTNKCCHKCFFCVYHSDFSGMHENTNFHDEIKTSKMIEILDDLKSIGVKAVTYSGGGEPLCHKGISDILQKTIDNGIDLSMLTNAQLLYPGKSHTNALLKGKWVRISIDYYDANSFTKSRGLDGKFFDIILDNIGNFSSNRGKNTGNCELGINFIITKDNYEHLFEATDMLSKVGVDNIRFSPVWVPNFCEYHAPLKSKVLSDLNLIRANYQNNLKIYDSYNISPEATSRCYNKCWFMQAVPVIGADLKIYNCHNKAYSEDGVIGDIKDKKFSEVWFSDEVKKYFNLFNPHVSCQHQCANDNKNKFIHELVGCHGDNFV